MMSTMPFHVVEVNNEQNVTLLPLYAFVAYTRAASCCTIFFTSLFSGHDIAEPAVAYG